MTIMTDLIKAVMDLLSQTLIGLEELPVIGLSKGLLCQLQK